MVCFMLYEMYFFLFTKSICKPIMYILYPKPSNWYSEFVKIYKDKTSNRYIRYLKDAEAERFIGIARMLNKENEDIHNWFADRFCEKEKIHFIKHKTYLEIFCIYHLPPSMWNNIFYLPF